MPEIHFTIDPRTGQLKLEVKGVAGPACDDVARLARELLGEPGHEAATAEYFLRPRVHPQVRPEHGR
jgi:hypothetical protein